MKHSKIFTRHDGSKNREKMSEIKLSLYATIHHVRGSEKWKTEVKIDQAGKRYGECTFPVSGFQRWEMEEGSLEGQYPAISRFDGTRHNIEYHT